MLPVAKVLSHRKSGDSSPCHPRQYRDALDGGKDRTALHRRGYSVRWKAAPQHVFAGLGPVYLL